MSFAIANFQHFSKDRDGVGKKRIPYNDNTIKHISREDILTQSGSEPPSSSCPCGGTCPKCKSEKGSKRDISIQTKLKVSQPDDPFEQEAEKVAEQVIRTPSLTVESSLTRENSDDKKVKRKCKKCEEEESKKFMISRKENVFFSNKSEISDNVVKDIRIVSSRGGTPLDPATREFMESRFHYDFGRVRIHTDSAANKSAKAVNAVAYTLGQNIVFGHGYPSSTIERYKLLAHELTHVIQQDTAGATEVQRMGDISKRPIDLPCELPHDSPSIFDSMMFPNNNSVLSGSQKAQMENFVKNWHDEGGNTNVRIDGFASERGPDELNWRLSCNRAQAVKAELMSPSSGTVAGIPAFYISVFAHGETTDFGPEPNNRLVTISIPPLAPPPTPSVPSTTPSTGPNFVCGPNVTKQVEDAVTKTKTTFAGWTASQKTDACDALTSLITGGYAWDINELHNNAWILAYRPACATAGATPHCGSSVQVGTDCHYAGSVNYVIFGTMCKLCFDYLSSIGSRDAGDFTEAEMLALINKYKGTGFTGLSTPVPNFIQSQEWAKAGYRGWPFYGAPAGDRSNCTPACSAPYGAGAFTVHWVPHGWF